MVFVAIIMLTLVGAIAYLLVILGETQRAALPAEAARPAGFDVGADRQVLGRSAQHRE